jgi:hypothetical protein
VLCINPPRDVATRFPASAFDDVIGLLHEALRPGGILVLVNSSYRLRDAPIFERFAAIRSDIIASSGFIDVFARDGNHFLQQFNAPTGPCYRLGPAFRVADDEELTECVFRKLDHAGTDETFRLAAPPEEFAEGARYCRSNLDAYTGDRAHAIEVFREMQLGHNTTTGERGQIVTTRWPSLTAQSGWHVRPPVWSPMPW